MTEEMPVGDIIATALNNSQLDELSEEELHFLAEIQYANDPDVSFDPEEAEEAGFDYHGSNTEEEMEWSHESNPLVWEVEEDPLGDGVVESDTSYEQPLCNCREGKKSSQSTHVSPEQLTFPIPKSATPIASTFEPDPGPRWNIFSIFGIVFAIGCIAAVVLLGVK